MRNCVLRDAILAGADLEVSLIMLSINYNCYCYEKLTRNTINHKYHKNITIKLVKLYVAFIYIRIAI